MKKILFIYLFYISLLIVVFRNTFSFATFSGGDYITLWPEHTALIKNEAFHSWDSTFNLGGSSVDVLHASPWNFLMGIFGELSGNNIVLTERLFWWIPFLILSIFSSLYLSKKIFPKTQFKFFSPFVFLFNTYVFMMIGGGQIAGIGLAYAISPFVLALFISAIDASNKDFNKLSLLRKSLLASLFLAVQAMFDYRIAYISIVAISLYLFLIILLYSRNLRRILYLLVYSFIIPIGVTGLLHAFWILPAVFVKNDVLQQLGSAFTSSQSVVFFSFAKFENTISLLHPNWPENIFGFVHFMKPEFLLIPIIAYTSLLFINSKFKTQMSKVQLKDQKFEDNVTIEQFNNIHILFFALLGLVGAFLAKGANDPFGGLYLWMFAHVPGFIMFRDPSKWYILVAVSYSVLIPFSVWSIFEWLNSKVKSQNSKFQFKIQKFIPGLFVSLFIIFWLFTIRQAILGQLGGTFVQTQIPGDYVQFKDFISNDQQFSRVLWIPEKQRFGFWSDAHPAVWSTDLFHTTSVAGTLAVLRHKDSEQFLQESAIKYIVVPEDSQKEIFLNDRKYDQKAYLATVRSLNGISWLKKVKQFGNIIVYEVPDAKDHFWSPSQNLKISYSMNTPTKYSISIKNAEKGDRIVFSESFARSWLASTNTFAVPSQIFDKQYNSFVLPQGGNYTLEASYTPQKWVEGGLVISSATLLLVLEGLFYLKKRS